MHLLRNERKEQKQKEERYMNHQPDDWKPILSPSIPSYPSLSYPKREKRRRTSMPIKRKKTKEEVIKRLLKL